MHIFLWPLLFFFQCSSPVEVNEPQNNLSQEKILEKISGEHTRILMNENHPEFDTAQALKQFLQYKSPFSEKELSTYLYALLIQFPELTVYQEKEKAIMENLTRQAAWSVKKSDDLRSTLLLQLNEQPRLMHWVFYYAISFLLDQKLLSAQPLVIFKKEALFIQYFEFLADFAEGFIEVFNNQKYFEFLRKKYTFYSKVILGREVKYDPTQEQFLLRVKSVKDKSWDAEEVPPVAVPDPNAINIQNLKPAEEMLPEKPVSVPAAEEKELQPSTQETSTPEEQQIEEQLAE